MTRALKFVGVALLGVVLTLLLVSILLPRHYVVERSVQIEATADRVWSHVGDLRAQEAWSPFKAMDPASTWSYGVATSGDGATVAWQGEVIRSGSYTIVRADPPTRLDYRVVFDGEGEATGALALEPSGAGTRLSWTIEGDIDTFVIGSWIAATMDGMLGPQFEDGLARLKVIAEATATERAAAPVAEPASVATGAEATGEAAAPAAAQ